MQKSMYLLIITIQFRKELTKQLSTTKAELVDKINEDIIKVRTVI